jgi:hypothetical protein
VKHPERVVGLVVQNGNAYDEGLENDFWKPLKGPVVWADRLDIANSVRVLDRPGNNDIHLAPFYSYGSNPPLYPKWHDYFRKHQPPTLNV